VGNTRLPGSGSQHAAGLLSEREATVLCGWPPASVDRIKTLIETGVTTHEVVFLLNRDGHTTARGLRWTTGTLLRFLSRIEEAGAQG
jgi:hypothetical protein